MEQEIKKSMICGGIGLGALLVYFGTAFYFDGVFCPNTTINGVDVSMQKVEDVIQIFVGSFNLDFVFICFFMIDIRHLHR